MANYQNLMAVINAVIKTNNRREITGQVLQNVLNTMVSSIGENMQLTGFATPTTNPGQPDQNIFYVAKQAGTYSHFNNITLGNGLSFLMWKNGQWSYETIGIPDLEWVRQNFVSIDFFRRIFRVLNSSNAEIFPNDTISAIDNVEALVAFWSDYYVSALGRGSGGGGGGGGGGDVTWAALADNSDNHQIALSHLTDALTGYATQSWVQSQNYATQLWVQSQSYATQTWVQNQSYASQSWVGQNYISISYFDRLFRAYNGSTLVNHNDTSSTIDNIKAMFGFWTDFYISALGGGGASSVDLRLAQLSDVNVAGVTNGQALVYDSTTQKWIPGTGGLDLTAMWTALGANTNNQINISHLTTALGSYATQQWVTSQGYLTPSAISDMATQTWVNTQISDMATKTWVNTQISDMATQTWVGQNYISIAYFDRLFRAYNGSTLVNHNNTTSTIDNIKAMLGFWTEYYLSALGNGGSIGSSISLSQLADVSISSPTNGQVLVYDSTTQKWKNGAGGGGGSGDVTWTALAAATNEQINATHLSTALSGYATTSDLSGYLPLSGGTMTGNDINFINTYRHLSAVNGTTSRAGKTFPSLIENAIGLFAQISSGGDEGAVIISPDTCVIYNSFDTGWGIQVHNEDIAADMSADTTRVFGICEISSKYYAWSSGGFKKDGSSDSYVLLGGGGHALYSFSTIDGSPTQTQMNAGINNLSTGSSTPTDNDYFISQYVGGGTTTTTYHRRPVSTLWTYISGKGDSRYVRLDIGASEQTIKSSISSISKGVINLWRNSGNDYSFLGFSNGTTETYLGGIGFLSQSDPYLYRRTADKQRYYKIWDEGNDGSGGGLDADLLDGQHGSYYAAASSLNNYLPLAGGTMTGTIKMTVNTVQLDFRPSHNSYNSRMEYMTNGNEAMVWANQNEITSFIFKCGLNLTNTSDWTGITPSLQIKGQSVYINSLIDSGTTPSYNFYVDGNAKITGAFNAGSLAIEYTNEINSYSSSGNVCINYRVSGHTLLCVGGGNVGVGTSSPSYKLHVSGSVYATGAVTCLSDERFKNVLGDTTLTVEQIAAMPSIRYRWNDNREDTDVHVGSIAQRWQTVLPEVVLRAKDDMGTLSINYGVAALVSSIITARKVVDHERRIAELEKENKRLKELLKVA